MPAPPTRSASAPSSVCVARKPRTFYGIPGGEKLGGSDRLGGSCRVINVLGGVDLDLTEATLVDGLPTIRIISVLGGSTIGISARRARGPFRHVAVRRRHDRDRRGRPFARCAGRAVARLQPARREHGRARPPTSIALALASDDRSAAARSARARIRRRRLSSARAAQRMPTSAAQSQLLAPRPPSQSRAARRSCSALDAW
jgi:hypothetical protein